MAIDKDGDIEIIIHVYCQVKDPAMGKIISSIHKYSTKIPVPTLEDARNIQRTPAEVNVYYLSQKDENWSGPTVFVWNFSLSSIKDVSNTGLNKEEATDAQDSWFGRQMNRGFRWLAKTIVVTNVAQAITGEDFPRPPSVCLSSQAMCQMALGEGVVALAVQ